MEREREIHGERGGGKRVMIFTKMLTVKERVCGKEIVKKYPDDREAKKKEEREIEIDR
jgi:hypothetical protein